MATKKIVYTYSAHQNCQSLEQIYKNSIIPLRNKYSNAVLCHKFHIPHKIVKDYPFKFIHSEIIERNYYDTENYDVVKQDACIYSVAYGYILKKRIEKNENEFVYEQTFELEKKKEWKIQHTIKKTRYWLHKNDDVHIYFDVTKIGMCDFYIIGSLIIYNEKLPNTFNLKDWQNKTFSPIQNIWNQYLQCSYRDIYKYLPNDMKIRDFEKIPFSLYDPLKNNLQKIITENYAEIKKQYTKLNKQDTDDWKYDSSDDDEQEDSDDGYSS